MEKQHMTEQEYWDERYTNNATGWDVGEATTPLKAYFDQLENKELHILIPGAGNAHEAAYLWNNGFKNVSILDISEIPLKAFKKKLPDFPDNQIIQQDFFKHKGSYDLIIEQTFFCSFVPTRMNRVKYATKVASLLKPNGKLVGLWFDIPLSDDMEKRPFGGSKKEYRTYFAPHFNIISFDKAHNSIIPRYDTELFGIFQKKEKPKPQTNNPLHGITLKAMLEELVAVHGWELLDENIRINCFHTNPTIKSSLRFLRKTPWAKEKVERFYLRKHLKIRE